MLIPNGNTDDFDLHGLSIYVCIRNVNQVQVFDLSKVARLYIEGGIPVLALNKLEKELRLSKPTV